MGIEKVVFYVRERVTMRSIDKNDLQLSRKSMARQRPLRRTLHERYDVLAKQRRSAHILDAAATIVQSEHGMLLAHVRKQQRAGAGTGFRRAADVSRAGVPHNGIENSRGKCASRVQARGDFRDAPPNLHAPAGFMRGFMSKTRPTAQNPDFLRKESPQPIVFRMGASGARRRQRPSRRWVPPGSSSE